MSWSLGSGFGHASFLSLPLELGFELREFGEPSVRTCSLSLLVVCPFPNSRLETSGLSRERKKGRCDSSLSRSCCLLQTQQSNGYQLQLCSSQLNMFWLWRRWWRSSPPGIPARTGIALLSHALLLCRAAPWLRPLRWSEPSLGAFEGHAVHWQWQHAILLWTWGSPWEDYSVQEWCEDICSSSYFKDLLFMRALQQGSHGLPCSWGFLQQEKQITYVRENVFWFLLVWSSNSLEILKRVA